MTTPQLRRRSFLLGGFATAATVVTGMLAGCSSSPPPSAPTSPVASPPPNPGIATAQAELSALEARFGGRIGLHLLDTGTGAALGHRGDERFLMCSTHKALVAAAILRLRTEQPGLLDRLITYDRSKLLEYAPVTTANIDTGLTVSALCEAAVTVSDNTADNLLFDILGGPAAATAFVRTLGDQVTRMDRIEPDLNVAAPGDERDTSTPAQLAATLRTLVLGDALDPQGRDLLTGWLRANTTGNQQIRAGVPAGWTVGDKTGSGFDGESNDIAVIWPPGRAPLVLTVFTVPADKESTAGKATIAEATRIAVRVFG